MVKLDGYTINREWTTGDGALRIFEAKDQQGQPVQIRMPRHTDASMTDRWFDYYDQYQLIVTNFKYLPRVIMTSMIDEVPYTILESKEGIPLHQAESLSVHQLFQLMDALRHLYKKKMVHGALTAENIWLGTDEQVVLYGAGEGSVINPSLQAAEETDIQQMMSIIHTYSLLEEVFLQSVMDQKPTTLSVLEEAMRNADQHANKPVKKVGLVEKEEEPVHEKKQVPAPEQAPKAAKPEQPVPPVNESNHEEKPKKKKSFVRKLFNGVIGLFALLFVVGLFSDEEEPVETVQQPEAVETAASQTESPAVETPVEKPVKAIVEEQEQKQPEAERIPAVSYSDKEIGEFMDEYNVASVAAINEADFSIVNHMIDPKGKAYNESRDYISYLEQKGITEDHIYNETTAVTKISEDMYEVETYEEYDIFYGDGSQKYKKFANTYHLKILEDGDLYVHELLSTDELSSEEIVPETSSEAVTHDQIASFMEDYLYTSVDAMNTNDFDSVSYMIDPEGEAYNESRDYIQYVTNKGIYEELMHVEIVDISSSNADSFVVSTYEEYDIYYGDGSNQYKTFNSKYLVVQKDGQLLLHKLINVDEV